MKILTGSLDKVVVNGLYSAWMLVTGVFCQVFV